MGLLFKGKRGKMMSRLILGKKQGRMKRGRFFFSHNNITTVMALGHSEVPWLGLPRSPPPTSHLPFGFRGQKLLQPCTKSQASGARCTPELTELASAQCSSSALCFPHHIFLKNKQNYGRVAAFLTCHVNSTGAPPGNPGPS